MYLFVTPVDSQPVFPTVKQLSPSPSALFGSKLSTASRAWEAKSARRSSKPPKKSCRRHQDGDNPPGKT